VFQLCCWCPVPSWLAGSTLVCVTYLWPAGVILFNSSVAGGPTCMRSGAIYAMTKAALNQLTRNLACEWASAGIRVNTVAPWVRPVLLGSS
jgi:NAD(P)-dependent dehydrogenase (short-subunit alcohol dehydrogenase family)